MRTITIEVTQDDIDKGIRCSSDECPIARAIRRKTSHPIFVGSKDICIMGRKDRYEVFTPQIEDFVCNFDNEKPVEPFTFELQVFAEDLKDAN